MKRLATHRYVRSVRIGLAVTMTTAAMTFAAGATPVAAATTCGSSTYWYFDGGTTRGPTYYVGGKITDRPIVLCTGNNANNSDSSVWVMIAGGYLYDYAQVGFGREGGTSTPRLFTEYSATTTGQWSRTHFSGFSPGTTHSYSVSFSFSSGQISMNADGVTQARTPFSADAVWGPGWTGQFYGEIHNLGDDFAGTSSAPVIFSNIQLKNTRAGAIFTPTSYNYWIDRSSDLSFGKQSWTSPSSFKIWTQR
jgi:hypothetical protein